MTVHVKSMNVDRKSIKLHVKSMNVDRKSIKLHTKSMNDDGKSIKLHTKSMNVHAKYMTRGLKLCQNGRKTLDEALLRIYKLLFVFLGKCRCLKDFS